MLLAEPPRTHGDLNFALLGFPVRIHPLFWLVALLLGPKSGDLKENAAWVAAMLISIIIHELGHALVMRAYGLQPSITLHIMGGLTSANRGQAFAPRLRPLDQVAISLAGPVAGFLLAAAICGAIVLSGHHVPFRVGLWFAELVPTEPIGTPLLTYFIALVLLISVLWGLFNLLPIYPLDGGQIARELFMMAGSPQGLRQSLTLSLLVAAVLAGVSVVHWHDYFLALFFGYLAFQSYVMLQAYSGRAGPW